MVPVPGFPWFHPKDCPAISEVVGLANCKIYGALVGDNWTITQLAQEVRHGAVLNLRSRDVVDCPGISILPKLLLSGSSSRKRSLSTSGGGGSFRNAIRIKSESPEVVVISSDDE
jgi:hypothetical protein